MPENLPARILSLGRTLRNLQRFARSELHCPLPAALPKRVWALRHGFLTESYVRYGLTSANVHEYVSDIARSLRTPKINGRFAEALNNKLVFSRMIASYGVRTPEYYGVISGGEVRPIGTELDLRSVDDVLEACLAGSEFVVKPRSGGSGVEVVCVTRRDGGVAINHAPFRLDDVRALLSRIESGVVTERIRQHPYADAVFPYSTNSIRVLTMWDPETDEPFIPFAGHRFGRPASVPTDNCSRGGIAVLVDVDRGVLVRGHSGHAAGEDLWYEEHPDTGARLAGLRLPNWKLVTSRLLELCREMSYIPYVGWDIVLTDDGFCVLEGNSYPDLGHQVFFPLLIDPRVRRFYEAHGVIGSRSF